MRILTIQKQLFIDIKRALVFTTTIKLKLLLENINNQKLRVFKTWL